MSIPKEYGQIGAKLEVDLIEWIDSVPEFASRSHAVRRCVEITRKLYEKSTIEEFCKFVRQ